MKLTFDQWKQRFIGALAVLCDDEEAAEAEADLFAEAEIDPENDCPIESAKATMQEGIKAA